MNNVELEQALFNLPDQVADALVKWRTASLERERAEAKLYLHFKSEGDKRTSDEIKAMVRSDSGRYEVVLKEIEAEVEYNRLNDRLLSFKKMASLRVAY